MCSINHDLEAIFIHIPKTAGTYMADILHKHYGFTNYYLTRPDHEIFCGGRDSSIKSHENKIHGTLMYYKTSFYCNKVMGMTADKWKRYYKFCFIRNPYDKIISGWNYVNQNKYPLSFYLNQPYKKNNWDYWHVLMSQTRHIINEKGKIGVDFIGTFEHLEEDFEKVLTYLELPKKHKPFKKNSKKHRPFYFYYTPSYLQQINHLLHEDFLYLSNYYTKSESFQDFIIKYHPNIQNKIREKMNEMEQNTQSSESPLTSISTSESLLYIESTSSSEEIYEESSSSSINLNGELESELRE